MDLFDQKSLIAIGKRLLNNKQTIAVAESVTAGLFQFALSGIPDAALFFQGGMTAYNLGQKYKHLQVEPLHAQEVNCVSQKVAKEMSLQVAELFTSNWGIGITGYATPVPESKGKLFAYYAFSFNGKTKSFGKISITKGDPGVIQLAYVNKIISRLNSIT